MFKGYNKMMDVDKKSPDKNTCKDKNCQCNKDKVKTEVKTK